MNIRRWIVCLLLLAAAFQAAQAHQVDTVELEFLKLDNEWRLEGEMDIAYMLPESHNVPGGLPLSRAAVMKESPEELARIRKETEATLRKLLRFTFAGKDVTWRVDFPDFRKEPFALPPEDGDVALITTRLSIDHISAAGELEVHWAGEQEAELIVLKELEEIVSVPPGGSMSLLKQSDLGISKPVESPATGGWVQSGFRHVLPLGLDHMLFIIGLFLLVPHWKPLMVQSLLFTVAHSLTLAIAVMGWVEVPGKWVEILIAVSIAWIGIENLLIRKVGKQRLILVFCFGLLHGLGFASVLAEKLEGIPPERLTGPLLGFNVGVELAQITVIAIAFVVLWLLRKWKPQVQTVGSILIALAGLGWVVERYFFA